MLFDGYQPLREVRFVKIHRALRSHSMPGSQLC